MDDFLSPLFDLLVTIVILREFNGNFISRREYGSLPRNNLDFFIVDSAGSVNN